MIWVEYALTGLLAGFLAGYLGIGGGLVLVPALSFLFSQDPAILWLSPASNNQPGSMLASLPASGVDCLE
jgi:uncharacterized membrane protein YfcA